MFGSRRERSIVRVGPREGRILRPVGASVCGGWSVLLPLRGPFHDDGESLPLRDQSRHHGSSFMRDGPREGRIVRGSRAEGASWPRPADRRPARAQTPRPGRGPFGDRPDSEPQRRSREREPSRAPQTHPSRDPPLRSSPFRSAAPLAPTATQQRARTQPRPADPPEPRAPAPVVALSERRSTRTHSDAAASENPAAPRRPTRAETYRPGRGRFADPAVTSCGTAPTSRSARRSCAAPGRRDRGCSGCSRAGWAS